MYALMARTILLYLLIVAGLRIMGKRQIGELQPSELVVTILISNIATLPIQDVDVPLSGGIVPILTIVCFEVFISGLTMRSRTARRLFCGGPKMVIRDGQIMQKELRDLRFSVDDLIEQLRAAGYFDPSEVLFAVVETTGSSSGNSGSSSSGSSSSSSSGSKTNSGSSGNVQVNLYITYFELQK